MAQSAPDPAPVPGPPGIAGQIVPQSLAAVELAEWEAYLKELARLEDPSRTAGQWYDDPLGFIDNCVIFPQPRRKTSRPRGLAPYQREIIASVPQLERVAVRGPRGLGKTTIASLVVLWFATSREAVGADWKVGTTAGSWVQLESFLWPEIKKWAHNLNWKNIGRKPFNEPGELQSHHLKLVNGHAFASSPASPDRLEGMHGDSILVVFDEAKMISPATFESVEGAFSGADEESGLEAFALCISTPGEPAGVFYNIHRKAPGWEEWHPRHVTLEEAIAAGRMSRSWAERKRRAWGEDSALYQNHVLGQFASSDEDAIVPLAWVEAAVERWHAWVAAGRPDPGAPHIVGVDVASTGADKSAAAIRWGNVITEVKTWARTPDTMVTTGRVKNILDADPTMTAYIDVIGIGTGVYDRLREQGMRAEAFDVRRKTSRKDATGQFGFVRTRDAAYYALRELLDPARGATLALPPVDELLGDLTALHYDRTSDGKVRVEEKADMRKRLGRSPDVGDAVAAALWAEAGSFLDVYGVVMCEAEKCGRGFVAVVDGKRRDRCPFCHTPLEDAEPVEDAPEAA